MIQKQISLYEIKTNGLTEYIVSDIVVPEGKLLATYSDIKQLVQLQDIVITHNPSVTYYTRTLTDTGRAKISATSSESQKGSKNNMYGTQWIHNTSKQKSKRIRSTDSLPDGWEWGRKIKWDKPK